VRPSVPPSVYGYAPRIYAYEPDVRVVCCRAGREARRREVLLGVASGARLSEAEGGLMVASPKKRKRLEAGEPRHPWKEDPYSNTVRPPFGPGNTASLMHGANSRRMLAPVAARLEAEIVEVAPWCARPGFGPAVREWAFAEAVCELYQAWFSERGLFGEDGKLAPGLVRWDRAEARASTLRAELGLTPQALASLLGSLATVAATSGDDGGLAALKAESQRLVAACQTALDAEETS
jgi:hypothetical protein